MITRTLMEENNMKLRTYATIPEWFENPKTDKRRLVKIALAGLKVEAIKWNKELSKGDDVLLPHPYMKADYILNDSKERRAVQMFLQSFFNITKEDSK